MTKIELFRKIYENHCKAEQWINRVPSEISAAFYDNPYKEILQNQSDMLLKHIFIADEIGDMEWFLYDWHRRNDLNWRIKDKEFRFYNIDEYIEFLIEHRGWCE